MSPTDAQGDALPAAEQGFVFLGQPTVETPKPGAETTPAEQTAQENYEPEASATAADPAIPDNPPSSGEAATSSETPRNETPNSSPKGGDAVAEPMEADTMPDDGTVDHTSDLDSEPEPGVSRASTSTTQDSCARSDTSATKQLKEECLRIAKQSGHPDAKHVKLNHLRPDKLSKMYVLAPGMELGTNEYVSRAKILSGSVDGKRECLVLSRYWYPGEDDAIKGLTEQIRKLELQKDECLQNAHKNPQFAKAARVAVEYCVKSDGRPYKASLKDKESRVLFSARSRHGWRVSEEEAVRYLDDEITRAGTPSKQHRRRHGW